MYIPATYMLYCLLHFSYDNVRCIQKLYTIIYRRVAKCLLVA